MSTHWNHYFFGLSWRVWHILLVWLWCCKWLCTFFFCLFFFFYSHLCCFLCKSHDFLPFWHIVSAHQTHTYSFWAECWVHFTNGESIPSHSSSFSTIPPCLLFWLVGLIDRVHFIVPRQNWAEWGWDLWPISSSAKLSMAINILPLYRLVEHPNGYRLP